MPFNEGTIAGTVAWAHDVSRQLGLDVKKLEDDVLVAYGKVVRFLDNGCFTVAVGCGRILQYFLKAS
jgi:hypothetical protein